MESKRHTSNRKCPDCGEPLFQLDPRSNSYGCDNEKCMAPWRLVNGRLSKEIGKQEVLKRLFHIRYYEQPKANDLMHADESKLKNALRPRWKVW